MKSMYLNEVTIQAWSNNAEAKKHAQCKEQESTWKEEAWMDGEHLSKATCNSDPMD